MKPTHWAPASREHDRREMLEKIGVKDALELYRDVPREIMLEKPPAVGYGRVLSEWELSLVWDRLMQKNVVFTDPPPFMGGGWCPHLVPSLVQWIVSRSEFLTAYTPYQPEINQGLLQALFEYQSLMADLLELDVVNASMYDGSTAAAEALLMAMRVTRRRRLLVAGNAHPEYLKVFETWLLGHNVEFKKIPVGEEGVLRADDADRLLTDDTAAVYIESPNFYGLFEPEIEAIAEQAHRKGALVILRVEPLSLGLAKPPGRLGADIAVAEGQPLGLGMNYGGPGLGVFAVKWDRRLVRQMPGRLIGMTRDAEGRRAFTMILQAREQHIRREKATSNITTNEALMAVAAAVYLSLLGGEGLRKLARSIWLRSHYLAKRLSEAGLESPYYKGLFFKEFTAAAPCRYRELHWRLLRRGFLGGLGLERFGLGDRLALFCATELHSKEMIDRFAAVVEEVVRSGCA